MNEADNTTQLAASDIHNSTDSFGKHIFAIGRQQGPFSAKVGSLIKTTLFGSLVSVMVLEIAMGNSLVLAAVARDRRLRCSQNWFIASLAVADLLVGVLVMPLSMANELMQYWAFGGTLCIIWLQVDVLLCTASTLNLCMISIDRYRSVMHPLTYTRKKRRRFTKVLIVSAWLMALLICAPPFLVAGYKDHQFNIDAQKPICALNDEIWYVILSTLGTFYIPLVVMVFVYVRLAIKARQVAYQTATRKTAKSDIPGTTMLDLEPLRDNENNQTASKPLLSVPQQPRRQTLAVDELLHSPRQKTTFALMPINLEDKPKPPIEAKKLTLKSAIKTSQCQRSSESYNARRRSWTAPTLKEQTHDYVEIESHFRTTQLDEKEDPYLCITDEDLEYYDDSDESEDEFAATKEIIKTAGLLMANIATKAEPIENGDGAGASSQLLIDSSTDVGGPSQPTSAGLSLKQSIRCHMLRSPSQVAAKRRQLARRRERRATLVVTIVIGTFVVCWFPFFTLYVADTSWKYAHNVPPDNGLVPDILFKICFWLGYVNSGLNPIIYTVFNSDFRAAFKKLFCQFRTASCCS